MVLAETTSKTWMGGWVPEAETSWPGDRVEHDVDHDVEPRDGISCVVRRHRPRLACRANRGGKAVLNATGRKSRL